MTRLTLEQKEFISNIIDYLQDDDLYTKEGYKKLPVVINNEILEVISLLIDISEFI